MHSFSRKVWWGHSTVQILRCRLAEPILPGRELVCQDVITICWVKKTGGCTCTVLPACVNNRAYYCLPLDLLKIKKSKFFSKKDLMFIPSTTFLKKKICERMVITLMIQPVILMLKDVV